MTDCKVCGDKIAARWLRLGHETCSLQCKQALLNKSKKSEVKLLIDGMYISESLDSNGELEICITDGSDYRDYTEVLTNKHINKEDAARLVEHVCKVFNLNSAVSYRSRMVLERL